MNARLAAALLALLLLGAGPVTAQRLQAVATTSDLRALTEEVGKGFVEVVHLAPPERDVEGYEPRPQDTRRLRDARLVVRVGLDYDLWFDRLLQEAGNPDLRKDAKGYVDASVGVPLLDVRAASIAPTPGHAHGHGNPHYWLDPANAEVITGGILEGLVRVDPGNTPIYRANRNAFLARLNARMEGWRRALEPYAGTGIVVFHDSWPYFARRFRLRILGQIEPKPGVPSSPAHLAALVRTMKDQSVRIIIKQPFESDRTPRMLAERTGAAIVDLVPSVGSVRAVDDYLQLFDYNVGALAKALGPQR